MKRLFPLYFLLAGTLFTACTTAPTRTDQETVQSGADDQPAATQAATETGAEALPDGISIGSLRDDLIYEVLVAEVAMQRDRPELAVKYYLGVARATHDPDVAARAVRMASFARADDEALEAAKLWVDGAPGDLEARRVLAILYLRTGQSDAALEQFENLMVMEPDNIGHTFLQIGALLRRELEKTVALEVMGNLVANHQDVPEAYFSLASLAVWGGDTDLASSSVDRALDLNPGWVDAVTLKARILREQGDNEGALTFLSDFLKEHPKIQSVRLDYARSLVDMRRFDEARSQFELLAVQLPENEDVLYALAMLSLQFNDLGEAKGYLMQMYKLGKRDELAAYYLGQIAEQQKQDEKALEWYSKVRSGEFRLDAQLRLAAVTVRLYGLQAALEHLHQVVVQNIDEQREVLLFEGSLLKNAQQYGDAFALYTRALEAMPEDAKILYARALVAERLDKLDIAEQDLRGVLKQEPDNVAAINALGYTLADRTTRYDEALELINRALKMEPEDPAIIDSMGWVHYRMGQYDQAASFLRKALERVKDPEIAAHLGEVLWVSGDKKGARGVWDDALKQFEDSEVLLKVMERFEH